MRSHAIHTSCPSCLSFLHTVERCLLPVTPKTNSTAVSTLNLTFPLLHALRTPPTIPMLQTPWLLRTSTCQSKSPCCATTLLFPPCHAQETTVTIPSCFPECLPTHFIFLRFFPRCEPCSHCGFFFRNNKNLPKFIATLCLSPQLFHSSQPSPCFSHDPRKLFLHS